MRNCEVCGKAVDAFYIEEIRYVDGQPQHIYFCSEYHLMKYLQQEQEVEEEKSEIIVHEIVANRIIHCQIEGCEKFAVVYLADKSNKYSEVFLCEEHFKAWREER